MPLPTLISGWTRYDADLLIDEYWNVAFADNGPGSIASYRNGGIGHVEWVNSTHDKAALLIANAEWRSGVQFLLWHSPAAGSKPIDLSARRPMAWDHSADPHGWNDVMRTAIAEAQQVVGIVNRYGPRSQPR